MPAVTNQAPPARPPSARIALPSAAERATLRSETVLDGRIDPPSGGAPPSSLSAAEAGLRRTSACVRSSRAVTVVPSRKVQADQSGLSGRDACASCGRPSGAIPRTRPST